MTEQQNPYVKQFPDLMSGKTIVYVHGFGSSGQSGTVTRLRTVLPSATVVAPDLPVNPHDALSLLYKVCEEHHPSLIIGTSMGGMYAEQLYGFDRILVNPAFGIADTMGEHGLTGKQQFFSPRRDGVQEFYIDKPMVKAYRQVADQNFTHADQPDEQLHVVGLFGDADPLVHTRPLFAEHYTQAIPFHGEHRLNDHSFMQSVVPVIRWIDDRQERRERPIVYVGIETLSGRDGQPAPSMVKAVRLLIERYQLYFVSPANDSLTSRYAEVATWLASHVGVPAWGHTVFTNQRHLLYGDYLIETAAVPGTTAASGPEPMATVIAYGSDAFKTWDEVIVYFERLGGQ